MPTPFSLTTPLPKEDLRFDSMQHSAALSTLEETQVFMLSDKPDIAPEQLLGQSVDVAIELRGGEKRHLNGYVTRFGLGRHQGRYFGYVAEVRSWLWFLGRRSDCRIFQDMTVRDIVEKIFADFGDIAVFEWRLTASYRRRTYCVQYRETCLNFVARLLEDEGIFWYFEHSEGEHKLILVDSNAALGTAPQAETLPYYGNTGQASPDVDTVTDLSHGREVRSGKTAQRSYNYESPSDTLAANKSATRAHSLSGYELFDYVGDYTVKGDGEQLTAVRLEEAQAQHERVSGATNAQGLAYGHQFTLARHPAEDRNIKYLVIGTQITASVNSLESGNDTGDYSCRFSAIPASQTYRPPRRTPKPFVQGPQSAVVTGPAGEEIFTDKYGRVKVQFHWDRYGQKNETSSCWMRVSHPWAGKSFGAIHIPRIGQEVIVDFLEGDPDQPLITGRVYNAEQMPPWDLPGNMTQSGILTRSSKGGAYGNANALRFEDKKGEEQVWLHAEKNQDIEVENDETHWVGHDRTKTIDHDETTHVKHDRTETVDNDERITIHHDRTETVDNNETITIHGQRTETVDKDEHITIHQNRAERVDLDERISIGANRREDVELDEVIEIGKNRSESVGDNETIRIGKNRSVTIGGSKSETVKKAKAETIGLAKTLTIGGLYQTSVGAAMNTTVALMQSEQVGLSKSINVGNKFSIEAGDELEIIVGKSRLVMKSDGSIAINGRTYSLDTTEDQRITAKDNIVMKGKKILKNC